MNSATAATVLATPMEKNSAGAATVGEYLAKLLVTAWTLGESYSGKRPFGNSDWQEELASALLKAGLLEGEWNEAAEYYDYSSRELDLLIEAVVTHVFGL